MESESFYLLLQEAGFNWIFSNKLIVELDGHSKLLSTFQVLSSQNKLTKCVLMAAALLIPSAELSDYGILVPQAWGHNHCILESSLKGSEDGGTSSEQDRIG